MNRSQRWSAAIGLVLVLLYVVPLFVPPGSTAPIVPDPQAGLWQRIFPGVPTWWVVGRLACLFGGTALLVWSVRARLSLSVGETSDVGESGARATPWIALFLAACHVVAGLFAAQFGRRAEITYFFFLAVPTALLAFGEIRRSLRLGRLAAPRLAILLIMPAFWLALCAPTAWRSPRAASLVDMWVFVERLERVALGNQTILADTTGPGHTNAYMMLEGIWLLGPDHPPTFAGLQISHAIVGIACALVVGGAAWLMTGRAAAIVAQAALLFSPYGISSLYEPAPMFFTCLCVASMLLLVLLLRRFRSEAAVGAFGVAAGISATDPPAIAMALVLCAVMAYSLWRLPRVPWLAAAVGALSGAAAIVPSLPTPGTLFEMARQYAFGEIELAGTVRILFGQETPFVLGDVFKAGASGPLDLPLGALLTPFAIARTPMRLWGDVLFEPISTVLMTVGLLLCARHGLRNRGAALLLVLLLIQLTQGFAATGDAVSHTRLAPALVPMSILSGLAYETLRRHLGRGRRALPKRSEASSLSLRERVGVRGYEDGFEHSQALATSEDRQIPSPRSSPAGRGVKLLLQTTFWAKHGRRSVAPIVLAVAASGIVLFSVVTPRIIPASSLAISFEALGTTNPNADAVFVQYDHPVNPKKGMPVNLHWLHIAPVARLLPSRPMRTWAVRELERRMSAPGSSEHVFFWSPALERDASISKVICGRWPGATLYTLFDEPRLYRALAAAPGGAPWRPLLRGGRWQTSTCPTRSPAAPAARDASTLLDG